MTLSTKFDILRSSVSNRMTVRKKQLQWLALIDARETEMWLKDQPYY
jgi:hypothetical protein